jgi:hypothetical protein
MLPVRTALEPDRFILLLSTRVKTLVDRCERLRVKSDRLPERSNRLIEDFHLIKKNGGETPSQTAAT